MKLVLSFIALIMLAACGKQIEEESQTPRKHKFKEHLSEDETWSILSERPLPEKIKVIINEMEFLNECTGLGRAKIERTYRNGTIHISSFAALRKEYFDVDIFDCEHGTIFYSEDYVDQTEIDHPRGGSLRMILRLRN